MKTGRFQQTAVVIITATAMFAMALCALASAEEKVCPEVTSVKIVPNVPSATPVRPLFSFEELSASSCPADSYPYRGLLLGADHGAGPIHHDNVYVRINEGPILYHGTIPVRKENDVFPDSGPLWHLYTRDSRVYTLYATSSYIDGSESALSLPFPLSFCYPSNSCSEQTVPIALAGLDQLVALGDTVTLDASESYDPYEPDSQALIYRWECYRAPEMVSLSDSGESAVVNFTPNTVGRYYFRLSVRDGVSGVSFNRSDVAYVRISVVDSPSDPNLVEANAGRTQQVQLGQTVTLDGSNSVAPPGAVFRWVQTNPVGNSELTALAGALGTIGCYENCHKGNFDGDNDADGADIALLANNWGTVEPDGEMVATFTPGLPRPYIFLLTVSYGEQSSSETAIVGAYHPNAAEVVTPPPAEESCLDVL